MEVKEIKKKVEKMFCADNGKRFSVGTDISFVLEDTGDKCIGTIRKIKKKHIVIDSIEVNGKPLPMRDLYANVSYSEIRPNSCSYVYCD